MRQLAPIVTPAPMTALAPMRVPEPICARASMTAHGPTETCSPSVVEGSMTAVGCKPASKSTGLSRRAARAKASRGCPTTSSDLFGDEETGSFGEMKTAVAREARAMARLCGSSAKTSDVDVAAVALETPSTSTSSPARRNSAPKAFASWDNFIGIQGTAVTPASRSSCSSEAGGEGRKTLFFAGDDEFGHPLQSALVFGVGHTCKRGLRCRRISEGRLHRVVHRLVAVEDVQDFRRRD